MFTETPVHKTGEKAFRPVTGVADGGERDFAPAMSAGAEDDFGDVRRGLTRERQRAATEFAVVDLIFEKWRFGVTGENGDDSDAVAFFL